MKKTGQRSYENLWEIPKPQVDDRFFETLQLEVIQYLHIGPIWFPIEYRFMVHRPDRSRLNNSVHSI